MADGADSPRLYLFFDDECPLCCRFKEWIEGRDRSRTICALALGDAELVSRFPEVDPDRARQQLTVRDRAGNLYEGLAALRQLALHLPGIRRLDWVYQLPGAQAVAGGLYRTVNRYRKRLCLRCGEKWMPSRKYSERKKGRRRL